MEQSKLCVEWRALDELAPYENNPRINDHAVDRMAALIREFGFRRPILVRGDGVVIDGHLMLKGALRAGKTHGPVLVCDDLTEAQLSALRLAMNKSAEWAQWDEEKLAQELQSIADAGIDFDLDLTGFSNGERLNILLQTEHGSTDPYQEWDGMPEYEAPDNCVGKVTVNFETEEDREAFFRLIGQSFTGKTKSIWYPEKDQQDLKSYAWDDDSKRNDGDE